MPRRPKTQEEDPQRQDDQQRLDDALSDTFPASDPVSFLQPGPSQEEARPDDTAASGAKARKNRRPATARPTARRKR